ncbi:MAG: hypothetical protein ACOWW1_06400 [archaeon]|nr:hypothetical protein [Candidatus Bathyarchaeum sp.]
MIPTVYAFLWSETINVEPKGRESFTLNRTCGKIVTVRIWSINGTYDDSINIWVTNPNGDTILYLGRVRVTNRFRELEFPTFQDGGYTVHFDNSFSSSPKTVEYMHFSSEDTFRPAYYVGLAMWVILPPIIKHIRDYGWFKTLAISLGIVAIVMLHLFFLLYINSPIII